MRYLKIAVDHVESVLASAREPEYERWFRMAADALNPDERLPLYQHMSSLFLNAALNRQYEWGTRGEERAHAARKVLVKLCEEERNRVPSPFITQPRAMPEPVTKADFQLNPEHEKILDDFLVAITKFRDSLPNRERDAIAVETALMQQIVGVAPQPHAPTPLPSDLLVQALAAPVPVQRDDASVLSIGELAEKVWREQHTPQLPEETAPL